MSGPDCCPTSLRHHDGGVPDQPAERQLPPELTADVDERLSAREARTGNERARRHLDVDIPSLHNACPRRPAPRARPDASCTRVALVDRTSDALDSAPFTRSQPDASLASTTHLLGAQPPRPALPDAVTGSPTSGSLVRQAAQREVGRGLAHPPAHRLDRDVELRRALGLTQVNGVTRSLAVCGAGDGRSSASGLVDSLSRTDGALRSPPHPPGSSSRVRRVCCSRQMQYAGAPGGKEEGEVRSCTPMPAASRSPTAICNC
jgi:hypothetical protein